ncbi:hypothetical protein AAMO2058_001579700 [Amorphochlora amoebiformis]
MPKLNPNAKPFRFNPKVRSFVPRSMRQSNQETEAKDQVPGSKPTPAPAPAPAPAVEKENKDDSAPAESWEDGVDSEPVKAKPSTPPKSKSTSSSGPAAAPASTPAPGPSKSSKSSGKGSSSRGSSSKGADKKAALLAELNKNGVKIPDGLKLHDDRPHCNVVFIGHVDAGKSTLSGQLLLLTGQVDQRTIEKYEREAKEKNRESWYLAFIMDTNEEERAKGKTVEVGRAHFETKKRRYTLLDAPGHKNYVPNMISGAAQADIGVLIISARKSEFEAGFDRGGQTREHAMLAKTLGISRLVVAINKMDESTVKWNKKRYDSIQKKLASFLKKWFKPKDTVWLPVSAYTGDNLVKPMDKGVCEWYNGPCLLDVLDNMRQTNRDKKAGLRIPIIDRYKDMGTVCALGKVEAGTLYKGQKVVVMPTGSKGECVGILVNEKAVDIALPGENVVIQTKGFDDNQLLGGFVICEPERPCRKCVSFEAQFRVTEVLPHKPLITSGYTCIFHCHTVVAECQIKKLNAILDKKSGDVLRKNPRYAKKGDVIKVKMRVKQSISLECYKDFSQLGRFTLRDEGKTIAIGRVTKIKEI